MKFFSSIALIFIVFSSLNSFAVSSKAEKLMTSLCAGVLILGTVPLVYDNIESSTSRTGINGAIKNSVAQALTALAKSNIYYSKSVSATMERNYFVDSQIQVTQQGNTTSLRVSY